MHRYAGKTALSKPSGRLRNGVATWAHQLPATVTPTGRQERISKYSQPCLHIKLVWGPVRSSDAQRPPLGPPTARGCAVMQIVKFAPTGMRPKHLGRTHAQVCSGAGGGA